MFDMLQNGGVFMYVILSLSVLAGALFTGAGRFSIFSLEAKYGQGI